MGGEHDHLASYPRENTNRTMALQILVATECVVAKSLVHRADDVISERLKLMRWNVWFLSGATAGAGRFRSLMNSKKQEVRSPTGLCEGIERRVHETVPHS